MELDSIDIHGKKANAVALALSDLTVLNQFAESSTERGISRRDILKGNFFQQIVATDEGGIFTRVSEKETSRRSVLKGMLQMAIEAAGGNVGRFVNDSLNNICSATRQGCNPPIN